MAEMREVEERIEPHIAEIEDIEVLEAPIEVEDDVMEQVASSFVPMDQGRVYTFGPTFRAENSNTSRHLSEFWMIEPEIAFADLHDDADLAEAYLKYIFKAVLDERGDDMAFFAKHIQDDCVTRLERFVNSSFERMTYTEAIAALESGLQDPDADLRARINRRLGGRELAARQYREAALLYRQLPDSRGGNVHPDRRYSTGHRV